MSASGLEMTSRLRHESILRHSSQEDPLAGGTYPQAGRRCESPGSWARWKLRLGGQGRAGPHVKVGAAADCRRGSSLPTQRCALDHGFRSGNGAQSERPASPAWRNVYQEAPSRVWPQDHHWRNPRNLPWVQRTEKGAGAQS